MPTPATTPTDSARRALMAAADSLRARQLADSLALARGDSIERLRLERYRADTIKPPLPVAPEPPLLEAAARWHWSRDQLFAQGAYTLGELLERIPGVSSFRAGWLLDPQALAWTGDTKGVRVFLDGVELDALGPRAGGVQDYAALPLAALESVAAERAPGELRVYLRSWHVQNVNPSTRIDAFTGSENTNFYRGFFGKRWRNGVGVQAVGQQFSTQSAATRGGGDLLSLMTRAGWARGRLSMDATLYSNGFNRSALDRFVDTPTPIERGLGAFNGNVGQGVLRLAWGSPGGDVPWVQLVAASQGHRERPRTSESSLGGGSTAVPNDTVDTAVARVQYVASAGVARWGARLEGTARLRAGDGRQRIAPALRASWSHRYGAVGAYLEREGPDSSSRTDLFALVTPVSWLSLSGSVARRQGDTPDDSSVARPAAATFSRLELALRWRGRTAAGGLVRRDVATVGGLPEYDSTFTARVAPRAGGVTLTLRAPLMRGFYADLDVVRWDGATWYRPQTEARTAFGWRTRHAISRGNFEADIRGLLEHRGVVLFPGARDARILLPAYTIPGVHAEIRIADAWLTVLLRNPFGTIYGQVPGYVMPRLVNYYGVRWSFWG